MPNMQYSFVAISINNTGVKNFSVKFLEELHLKVETIAKIQRSQCENYEILLPPFDAKIR